VDVAGTAWEHLGASYDDVADVYDTRFADELDAKPADRELLERFVASTTGPLVDIGCGPGHIGAFVRARGHRVVGLDLSPAMARRASARLDGAVVGDVRALPFADRSIGGIVAFYSLIHVRRPELVGALGEIRRVLRPGGRTLFSAHEGTGDVVVEEFLGRPSPFAATLFTLDELVAAATGAGLEVTTSERRPPYPEEGRTTRLYVGARRPSITLSSVRAG